MKKKKLIKALTDKDRETVRVSDLYNAGYHAAIEDVKDLVRKHKIFIGSKKKG